MRRKQHRPAARICDLLGGFLLLAVILCCIPLTLPRLAGWSVYQVISGSMEPSIPTGSLVYVAPGEAEEAEEGDVIAFYSASGSGAVIVHRVVQNQVVSGELITKGDANSGEDPEPVQYSQYMGRVVWHIPLLGHLLAFVVTPQGRVIAVCAVAAAALLHAAGGRLRRKAEKEE